MEQKEAGVKRLEGLVVKNKRLTIQDKVPKPKPKPPSIPNTSTTEQDVEILNDTIAPLWKYAHFFNTILC